MKRETETATITGGALSAVLFLRALAARPDGQAPVGRNGKPQKWNRARGFHESDGRGGAPSVDDLARFTALQEAASRRRSERALAERVRAVSRAETHALIARAERKIAAPLTVQGQIVAAFRRGCL